MQTEEELANRIVRFTSEKTGINESKLELTSRLFHDLGIDGEDALEFFDAFSKEFNVDISELSIGCYFGNEGTMTPFGLINALFLGKHKEAKKELTIKDLVQSAKQGHFKIPVGPPLPRSDKD